MSSLTTPASAPRRIAALLVALGLTGAGLTACGLPQDDQVTTYQADELPDVLANTTTTSTTTTTLPPASTVPMPDTGSSTTTIPPVETTSVDVYYTLGFSDDLQRITLNLPFSPVSLAQLTSVIETPPPEVSQFNLRSSVRPGLITEIVPDRGTANVELSQDVLNRMTSSQERRAIAQIVLTLASFVTPADGAIGLVRFTVDDEPIPVFLPSVGGDSDPGEAVAYSDFAVLVTPVSPTTTTTTTTTSTTTTTTTTTTVPSTATDTTDDEA